jgi:GNAT superfamily N-acetyltransferase
LLVSFDVSVLPFAIFSPLPVLNILAVKQEYQRQGVGALLLQDGLDLADAANLPLWLGSSVPALGLYQKNLFKLEGAKSIDLKKYGGETVETHMVMIRPAQSPGSQVRLDSEKAT